MGDVLRKHLQRIPWYGWVLLLIMVVGGAFRLYHFHDWLQFKGDAFRDATFISDIDREGWQALPLLGPRAGGTMLRLGPIFYYFQYAAAQLFHSLDAPVLAYPDLFFSVLTIPLFFFFSRRYFSFVWSLSLAGMLAVSFMAIEYGRFAWNPNATIFFSLIFSYALLRLYDAATTEAHRWRWAALAATGLAVASQLHFVAFLGLPLVLALFAAFRFRVFSRVWSVYTLVIFVGCLLLLYSPVLWSEYFKSGENTRLFFAAISSKADSHGLGTNVWEATQMFSKYFLRIWAGILESGKLLVALSGLLCVAGFLANVLLLRGERDQAKKDFLLWSLLLMAVYFLLYIPLAFKIDRPRFYLPFLVVPYLYLGYGMIWVRRYVPARLWALWALLAVAMTLFLNMFATTKWFMELHDSQQTVTSTGEKNSKGRSFWLTWGHFERAARVMDEACMPADTVFFSVSKSIQAYDHSIEYALLRKRAGVVPADGVPGSCYFYVALPRDAAPQYLQETSHHVADVGNLMIYQFSPPSIAAEEAFMKKKIMVEREIKSTQFIPEKRTRYSRVYWGDVFNFFHSAE